MRLSGSALPRVACALAFAALAPHAAHAEKADRDKPINFSADQPAEVDFQKRVGTLKGNVVITQGTMSIHADRIDFKQNADNSLSATAWGNPVSFRQKKDGSDEYDEGYAQRAVYDGEKQTLELFDNALLKEGKNELRSNYIWYNSATDQFRSEARPNAPGAPGPGARVQGVFQPRSDTPLLGTPPNAPKGNAKQAPAAKDNAKEAPAGKGGEKGNAPPKNAPPLTLTPDASLTSK